MEIIFTVIDIASRRWCREGEFLTERRLRQTEIRRRGSKFADGLASDFIVNRTTLKIKTKKQNNYILKMDIVWISIVINIFVFWKSIPKKKNYFFYFWNDVV